MWFNFMQKSTRKTLALENEEFPCFIESSIQFHFTNLFIDVAKFEYWSSYTVEMIT